MTLTLKTRDVAAAILLLALGVVIGLSLAPAPSRAQNVGGASSYIEADGRWWHCTGRDCVHVRFDRWN